MKFVPHAAVRWHQNTECQKLRTNPATALSTICAFGTADFSQNVLFREAMIGTSKQWMQKREFSLENYIQHSHKKDGDKYKLEETHHHYICEDPKHNVRIFYLLMRYFEVHLHAKSMDAWMGRVKVEYPHVKFCVFASDNSPTQYRLATAFEYYQFF